MKKYIAFFLVIVAIPLFAQEKRLTNSIGTNKDLKAEVDRVSRLSGNRLSVLQLNSGGLPHLIRGNVSIEEAIISLTDRGDVAAVKSSVTDYVQTEGRSVLGLNENASIVHAATNQVSSIWHSAFEIQYNGIPLRDRIIHVHTGVDNGKVVLLRSDVPAGQPNIATPWITELKAAEAAERMYSGGGSIPFTITEMPKLVYVNLPTPSEVRLAWETTLSDGFHQWRYTIDADDAAILEVRDMVVCNIAMEELHPGQYGNLNMQSPAQEYPLSPAHSEAPLEAVSGRVLARVHLTKPSDTLTTIGLGGVYVSVNNQQYLTDSLGNWSANTTYPVVLSTQFSGPYFVTLRKDGKQNGRITKTIQSGSLDVLWDNTNSDPSERDVCYAVNLARDHVIGVDTALTGINDRLTLNVNLNQTCNAYYDAQSRSLNFFSAGGNCANTGQIMDVIAHEFGHRVNHVRYKKAGKGYMNDRSLDEGFADLSSNFLRDDPVIGRGFFGNNTILRNSDNTTIWPKDISPDGHITGVIIAGAVWDLRKLIGHDEAERLYDLCGYLAPDGNGFNDPNSIKQLFTDVLAAFLSIDDNDGDLTNGTPHAAEILKAFQLHNIGIQNYFDLNIVPIADASALEQSYPVRAFAPYYGITGSRTDTLVKIHYSIDDGKTYSEQTLVHADGEYLEGSIPKVPQHSIVKYFLTAGTNYTDAGSAVFPLYTSQPFSFLVGYNSKSIDECEVNNGWAFTKSAATAGLWVLEKPNPTTDEIGEFIQQDSDHTQNGTSCVITGNTVTDFSIEDAVRAGTVTATSPAIDVAGMESPVIRFWYYYTNDQGQFGGSAPLKISAAANGGSTYKVLNNAFSTPTNTNPGSPLSTKGWKPFAIKVKDALGNSVNTVKIRVVATGTIAPQTYPDLPAPSGHIIEAGIDDIEVLDFAQLGVNDPVNQEAVSIQPNPAKAGLPIRFACPGISDGTISYEIYNNIGTLIEKGISQSGLSSCSVVLPQAMVWGTYQIVLKSGSSVRNYHFIVTGK